MKFTVDILTKRIKVLLENQEGHVVLLEIETI